MSIGLSKSRASALRAPRFQGLVPLLESLFRRSHSDNKCPEEVERGMVPYSSMGCGPPQQGRTEGHPRTVSFGTTNHHV